MPGSVRLTLLAVLAAAACHPSAGAVLTAPVAVTDPANGPMDSTAEVELADSLSAETLSADATDSTGDAAVAIAGAISDVPPAPPADASWDIEIRQYLTHDRVEYYLRRFTGEARERIVSWMQRGIRYEPMIRQTFREAGIAEDMYYLALVESGYDPHAYSRAAAVGMWQFIASTGRGMGLRIDWWVDERRDPMRSTRAAARFLGSLRDQFGSMYLAAAAYNGGPGRVSRGLTRFATAIGDSEGDDQFFALAGTRALKAETSNYVPQLIAAAAIGKEPWKYGISFDSVASYAYDSVRVPAGTAVGAVALASGAALDAVRDLNPHLLRGATPPKDSTWVRVPVGLAASFDSEFAALPDSTRNAWRAVKVRKATTLATLAKGAGVTTTQLRWYNPIVRGTRVAAGATVNVPTRLAVRAAFDVPDPGLSRGGAAVNGVHVVRRGETLSHIARWNGTSVARLMALNGLKKSVIFPGQSIRVRPATTKKG
jgi:membrane-bound lytic murein transglycosylase D